MKSIDNVLFILHSDSNTINIRAKTHAQSVWYPTALMRFNKTVAKAGAVLLCKLPRSN